MLECYRHEFPARLVRLIGDSSSAISLIAKKVKLAKDLLSIPPSAKLILKTLEYEGDIDSERPFNKNDASRKNCEALA